MKMHPDGSVDVYAPKDDTAADCVVHKWCDQHTVNPSGATLTIIEKGTVSTGAQS